MDYKDYYKILGVPRTATAAEIKKAFRKLARQHHPDLKPGDKGAEQQFKDVNEANEVLSDPAKRKQYDELGANWEAYARAGAAGQGGQGSPFGAYGFGTSGGAGQSGNVRYEFRTSGGEGFSDFFRTFFGGAAAGAAAGGAAAGGGSRGRRTATAEPSIEELFGAMNTGPRTGTGSRPSGSPAGAPAYDDGSTLGHPAPVEAETELSLDEAYHGTTRLVEIDGKRLEVALPPGVDTGSRIRLKGKGGGTGPVARDLYIVSRVRPHHTFTRKGPDLTRDIKVTLREAVLGGEIPVRTLKGRVLLTIPPATQNGRMFRLTGQGMPRLKGGGNGDLFVRIAVVMPPSLSPEALTAAATFLDLVEQPDPRGA